MNAKQDTRQAEYLNGSIYSWSSELNVLKHIIIPTQCLVTGDIIHVSQNDDSCFTQWSYLWVWVFKDVSQHEDKAQQRIREDVNVWRKKVISNQGHCWRQRPLLLILVSLFAIDQNHHFLLSLLTRAKVMRRLTFLIHPRCAKLLSLRDTGTGVKLAFSTRNTVMLYPLPHQERRLFWQR